MPVRLNSLTFNGAIHEIHGSTIVGYEVLSHRILCQDSLYGIFKIRAEQM